MNLLKIFTRRVRSLLPTQYSIFSCLNIIHFFFQDVFDTLLRKDYPPMKCCFNKNQLEDYIVDWQKFQHANDYQYNSQEKIRETLFKTYGPEFYANVKRVREAWFINYESKYFNCSRLHWKLLKFNSVANICCIDFLADRLKLNNITLEEQSKSENSENKTCIEVPKIEEVVKSDEKPAEPEVSQNRSVDQTTEIVSIDKNVTSNDGKSSTDEQEEKPKLKT